MEPMTWRLHVYRQDDHWALEPVRTFEELRAELDVVGMEEDWVYIERHVDGEWVEVAFAGLAPPLPDAWEYQPEGDE